MGFDYQLSIEGEDKRQLVLLLDGALQKKDSYYIGSSSKCVWVSVLTDALYEKAVTMPPSELLDKFNSFEIRYPWLLDSEFPSLLMDTIEAEKSNGDVSLELQFRWDYPEWKQPWTIGEHYEEFRSNIENSNLDDHVCELSDDETILNGFVLRFAIANSSAPISDWLARCIPSIKLAHLKTMNRLSLRIPTGSIGMRFDFPEEVRVPCEQYLLYFTQFLLDVGVGATASISEHAGKVLFTVTPQDRDQALEKLHAALDLYLRLPSSPAVMGFGSPSGSIEVQRLLSNVFHLKGQLALATALIQQQCLTIQSQQSLIQQQLLSGQIMIDAMQKESDENKELVVGDVIALKKVDLWDCIEVDLPTMMRRLKRWFSGGEGE